MTLPQKVTNDQVFAALEKHNGLRAAAAAELGIAYRVLIQRLARMRGRGMDIPQSTYHTRMRIHGTSELLGPDGETKLTWVKKQAHDPGPEVWADIVKDVFADTEPVATIAAPPHSNKDLLVAIPIGDHHCGQMSWHEEAGDDYDIKISEQLLVAAAEHLLDVSPSCDTCLIVNVGDYFHRDSQRAETTTSRNLLDVDTRYIAMVRAGVRMLRTFIDGALKKYRKVRVINSPANHDPVGALWLSLALALLYEKNPRVEIDQCPAKITYYQFGKVMIAVTHGDTIKMDRITGVIASDQPEMWGQTVHRYVLSGHIHQRKVLEFPGCMVESFRTLAAKDAWAAGAGFRSGRDMTSIVLHREHGEVARHRFAIGMLE